MNCLHKVFVALLAVSAAHATPVHLRCEQLNNPLGMDALHPMLSWQSDNTERNWHRSAYQILVALSTGRFIVELLQFFVQPLTEARKGFTEHLFKSQIRFANLPHAMYCGSETLVEICVDKVK